MSNADHATHTRRGYQSRDHFAGCKRVDPYVSRRRTWPWALACATLAAIPLALIFAAPVMREPAAQPASEIARLVGLGCGPDRLTLYAVEESDFPKCDTIDTPERLCGPGVNAPDCAAYLGEGW